MQTPRGVFILFVSTHHERVKILCVSRWYKYHTVLTNAPERFWQTFLSEAGVWVDATFKFSLLMTPPYKTAQESSSSPFHCTDPHLLSADHQGGLESGFFAVSRHASSAKPCPIRSWLCRPLSCCFCLQPLAWSSRHLPVHGAKSMSGKSNRIFFPTDGLPRANYT